MLHHNPRPRSWELRGICWEPQALQLDRLDTRGSPQGRVTGWISASLIKFDGWKMIDIPQLTRWNIGQSEELRWVYHHNWGSVEKIIPNTWVGMVGHVAHCCPLIMGVSGFLFSPKSVWGDPFRKKKWRASASILCGIHKQRKTRCYNIWRHKYKIIQVSIDTIDAFFDHMRCHLSLVNCHCRSFLWTLRLLRNSGLHRAVVMATIHKN